MKDDSDADDFTSCAITLYYNPLGYSLEVHNLVDVLFTVQQVTSGTQPLYSTPLFVNGNEQSVGEPKKQMH